MDVSLRLVFARCTSQTQVPWFGFTLCPSRLVAMSVSMAIHILLVFSVGFSGGMVNGTGSNQNPPAAVILVSLNAVALAPESNDSVSFPAPDRTFGELPRMPRSTIEIQDRPGAPAILEQHLASHASLIPVIRQDEQQYFHSRELSEKALILNVALLDSAPLLLTDVPSQLAVLRFLINEQGNIDQVLVEGSRFSPRAERLIVETFSKLKFQAGKIGDLAVKSQLRIEIKVQNDGELLE